MRSRFLIFSLFFVLLFAGCTAQKRDPIVGAYSPEDGTDGIYLFLEDGTPPPDVPPWAMRLVLQPEEFDPKGR